MKDDPISFQCVLVPLCTLKPFVGLILLYYAVYSLADRT